MIYRITYRLSGPAKAAEVSEVAITWEESQKAALQFASLLRREGRLIGFELMKRVS